MKRCAYCGKSHPDDPAVCPTDATRLEMLPDPSSSSQVATPKLAQSPETLQPGPFPARKALVTLAVFVMCLVAQQLPLPTVENAETGDRLLVSNSILVLGVRPVLLGFVLVECVALLVPAWRPLRAGGRAGREKLRHASLILGMLLAAGQAFVMAAALGRTSSTNYGAGFLILTVLILLGATAALIGLARVVDEEGLGGGFPILLLAFTVPEIARQCGQAYSAVQQGFLPGSVLQTAVFGVALLVGATLWFFSPYSLPGNEPGDDPALLSRPACGVAPLSVAASIFAFSSIFSVMCGQSAPPHRQFEVVEVIVGVVAAIGFAYVFNHPDRFKVMWKALSPHPPERLPRIKAVMTECIIFIVLALLVQAWLHRVLISDNTPVAIPVILVTGIIADLIREWLARTNCARLVPVWEIHQVYAVPPAMRLLQAHGFHPFSKGLRLRSLLQFFGPYAPVELLVPAEEAQAAYALLESRWPVLDQPRRLRGAPPEAALSECHISAGS